MKKIILIFLLFFGLFSFAQESTIYTRFNRSFIAYAQDTTIVYTINRAKEVDSLFNTALEVFYTVSGSGASELDLVSGSATIPIDSAWVDIPIGLNSSTGANTSDRDFIINITPNANYTIQVNQGIDTIAVKDKMPLKAFPTAYGGGAYATGGRGGNVYHVTKVVDDSSVGTLRWALTQPRPATIIFDVSGVMELAFPLTVEGDNLTVAGQTAPNESFIISAPETGNLNFKIGNFSTFQNHIWRYIKVRNQFYTGKTAFTMKAGYGISYDSTNVEPDYGKNLIFDHWSVNWSDDESFSFAGDNTENITLQNSMLAETVRGSLFGDSAGFEIPMSRNNTFRQNVLFHMSHRLPNINGVNIDAYNNVVYDWKNRLTTISNGTKLNQFNNYYYKGNRTNIFGSWNDLAPFDWFVNGITYKEAIPADVETSKLHSNPNTNIKIHTKNNVIQSFYDGTQNANDKYIWMHHAGYLPDGTPITANEQQEFKAGDEMFRATPFPYVGAVPDTFLTAEQSKTIVPEDAGANKFLNEDGSYTFKRDEADQKYRNEIINDTPTSWNVSGSTNTLSDPVPSAYDSTEFSNFQASITGIPTNTRPADFYDSAKSEHIPHVWFDANVPSGEDHNDIAPSGYTWMEEYINSVDEPSLLVARVGDVPIITCVTNCNQNVYIPLGGTFNEPSGTYFDTEDGSGTATIGGDTVNVNLGGVYTVILSYSDQDGNVGNMIFNYTVGIINGISSGILSRKSKTILISN